MESKEFKRDKEDKEHKKIQVFFNHGKEWKKSWTKNTKLFFKEAIKKPQ